MKTLMGGSESQGVRAIAAGAVCLVILSGMIVLHAWPLWTGTSVILPVIPVDPRDMFRGEYVRLSTPAMRLPTHPDAQSSDGSLVVPIVGGEWGRGATAPRVVYVQLEPSGVSGNWAPVSVSRDRIAGRTNLRGRVRHYDETSGALNVAYGLDRYYMQEGTARPVEDAIRDHKTVQMEIAVAASGRARIRRLLVAGVPAGQ